MFGKLLVSASFAALLIAAPAAAQDQDQGQGGQNKPILMKPQGQGQGQGQDAGQAAGAQRQSDQAQGAGDQGQMKKKLQNSQKATGEQPASEAQATGQDNQGNKKKKIQQNIETEQGGTAKKQNAQQTGQDNDPMTTGATGKAERDIPIEKRTVIREKIITRNVTRIERDKIDFDINIGIAVPGTIALQPLPPDIIEVVPAYQGYQFFVLSDGTIIIVDPGTLQIVYVLAG
jgi:hypothetical protein